jgi:signal transduction histidine kinase
VEEPTPPASAAADAAASPFRLLRTFAIAATIVFVAVAAALFALQRGEERFFADNQRELRSFFAAAQADFAERQEAAARAGLVAVHEAAHVNLARVMANTLWDSDFGPLVRAAERIPLEHCRTGPAEGTDAGRECLQQAGARIRTLPGFAAVDAKARDAMRATSVFKVKVWDRRGIAVYSSEQRQVGEDGSANAGWRVAMRGTSASELTHRERFSAFERVVEDRDLISSYVPVRAPGSEAVVGVFEIYSDVTALLEQTRSGARAFAELSRANDARVAEAARRAEQEVEANSGEFIAIVGGLIVLLLAVSLAIVAHGQRIIDRQWRAAQQAVLRERLWHREKMAALAAMAANVAHEIGNPLAVIAGTAQALPEGGADGRATRAILGESARIAAMMRRISDFADARSEAADWVDVNALLRALVEFFAFDRRFRAAPIGFEPGEALPAVELVPDRLNEAMMALLLGCVGDASGAAPRCAGVSVASAAAAGDGGVEIRVTPELPAAAAPAPVLPRAALDAAQRAVLEMGGTLVQEGATTVLRLPLHAPKGAPTGDAPAQ